MKTKKIVLLALFVFTSGLVANAQEAKGPMGDSTAEEKARMTTDKQKENLDLSEAQEEEMYAHNLKYIQEMEEIMAGGKSMATMMKLKDMSGRKDKEAKEILSKDQYKIYLESKEEMREQMKKRMKG